MGVPTTPVKKYHAPKEDTDVTTLFVQHVLNFLTLGKRGVIMTTGVPTCANFMERQESRNMAPFTEIYRVGWKNPKTWNLTARLGYQSPLIEAIVDKIQLNDDGDVVSCDGVSLEQPMPVADFVSMMQKTRQAVEIYFDMVMKAEKGLNDFLKGDSKAASIANAFKETLTKEFAEKNGVEIHSFSPSTHVNVEFDPESPNDPGQKSVKNDIESERRMKPQDLHNKYRAPSEWADRVHEDILIQQLVVLCEEFVRENSRFDMEPERRKNIRWSTNDLWKNIEKVFASADQSDALDSRLEPELQYILIAAGWRVIARLHHTGGLVMLPHGLGVPGCFWAKTAKDDHPFWAE